MMIKMMIKIEIKKRLKWRKLRELRELRNIYVFFE